jgi:hypothetical protein
MGASIGLAAALHPCHFFSLPRIKGAVMSWMWWLGNRGGEQH